LNVHLVGAGQAGRLTREATNAGNAEIAAEVDALLRVFHARHVGLPPAVARTFSEAFVSRGPADFSNTLRLAIYRRLLDALGASEMLQRDPRQFDIVPRHLLIDLCLLPLSAIVVRDLGRTYLFSTDPAIGDVGSEDYHVYQQAFADKLLDLCTPPRKSHGGAIVLPTQIDLFWERSAHRLWSVVQQRRRTLSGDASSASGEIDGLVLRFICGLEPELRFDSEAARLRTEIAEEQNPLFSHPRQGGVVDIHATPRIDDIEDFLLTEFIVPKVLLADKLLNGMSMAKHRPPPFDERRSVLVLGATVSVEPLAPLALARAAWLEAVFRFAIVLFKHELLRSELRFGRWTEDGGYVDARVKVGDTPTLSAFDVFAATRLQMRQFFCEAGWLPGLVANQPRVPASFDAPDMAGDTDVRRLEHVLRRLAPEVGGASGDAETTDFRLALLVALSVFNEGPTIGAATRGSHRRDAMPLHVLDINCPRELLGGEVFLLDDGVAARRAVAIAGEPGRPADRMALSQVSASLSEQIFKFYWEGMDA